MFPESRMTLIRVLKPTTQWPYGGEDGFDVEQYRKEQRRRQRDAEEMLGALKSKAVERGVDTETMTAVGNPAKKILEAAEENHVDHIVMGSHGRSGFGRVLFGSVAETVTRRSSVPVTIVR